MTTQKIKPPVPTMKVKVSLVADVFEGDERLIASILDREYTERRATIVEMREFFRRHGARSGRRILDRLAEREREVNGQSAAA